VALLIRELTHDDLGFLREHEPDDDLGRMVLDLG
jgi:hypothetical protein